MRYFLLPLLGVLLSLTIQPQAAMAFSATAYVPTTVDNLLGAYWRLGRMRGDSPAHIEQSLQVLECDIYSRFRNDEIELAKIRGAFLQKLQLLSQSAPLHLQFTQPLLLDNYDFQRKAFVLSPTTRWNNVFRQRISGNTGYINKCTNINTVPDVPLNAIIRQAQPFSMVDIPMAEPLAQRFIQYTNALGIDVSRGRPAYAVFYITLGSYLQDVGASANGDPMAEFSGQIDRVEIYADAQKQRPIYVFEPSKSLAAQVPAMTTEQSVGLGQ